MPTVDTETDSSPRRRTQLERRVEAEKRLVEAAAILIGESGTNSLTLASIGERAGYSRGLARHHFGSKAALMERLVQVVHREFFESWAQAVPPNQSKSPDQSATDQLVGIIQAFYEILADLPPIHRAFLVLWANAPGGTVELRSEMAKSDRVFRSRIAEILNKGISEGEFRESVDRDSLAVAIAGMLRGIALQFLIDEQGIDLHGAFAETEATILSRVRQPSKRQTFEPRCL